MKRGPRKIVPPFMRKGWTVEYRSKHVVIRCPRCSYFHPLASNIESEWHAVKNLTSALRRHERQHETTLGEG